MRKHGNYIPRAHYEDKPYYDYEYQEQLRRMTNSAAGFDGWTKDSLKLLPSGVWEWRARIDNMAKSQGVVPSAYLHVPSPMIPKGHATQAKQHRGIVLFSVVHRVLCGIEWHRLKHWQEKWIDEGQHGGRLGGEHMADAWDLQCKIEAAHAEQRPLVGVLLDHAIVFTSLTLTSYVGCLRDLELPLASRIS